MYIHIYTNGPSSILSSCFRQKSRNNHLISSLLHGSWIGVKSIILAYTHFRVIKKKTTKLFNNIRFYDSEFSWCQITSSISMIFNNFNIYDLQLPTISVPAISACIFLVPATFTIRATQLQCLADPSGPMPRYSMASHGVVEEFSTLW